MRKIGLLFGGLFVFLSMIFFLSTDSEKEEAPIKIGDGSRKTICLNMIVKNESAIIEKCLASVKPLIDYWVIIDTGSTDGTQEVIKKCMKDVPGKLYERPWVNFAHNRNEVFEIAKTKTDYSLFIDADEALLFSDDFVRPALDKDIYYITIQQKGASEYLRTFLVNNKLDWQWKGVIHEDILSSQVKSGERIKGVVNFSDTQAGNRSKDPRKYLRDAEVLSKALKDEPENTRYQFYLAQACANAGEYALAMEAYKKRSEMKGREEEIFWSLLHYARIQQIFCLPSQIFIQSYYDAYKNRPSRAEPLYYIGRYYLSIGRNDLAYEVLKKGALIPQTQDTLFVERHIYDWELKYKLAEACYRLGKYDDFRQVMEQILVAKNVPANVRAEMERNLMILKTVR